MSDGRHHHDPNTKILEHLHRDLSKLAEKIHHMTTEIDTLKSQVATTIDLQTRAIALLQSGGGGLPPGDIAQVVVLTTQLKTSSDALAAVLGGVVTPSGGSETADVQALLTLAQQTSQVSTDPQAVLDKSDQMSQRTANLVAAFNRNSPILSSSITAQLIAQARSIDNLIATLTASANDSSQVSNLALQIQNAAQSLSAIIAQNPRGGPAQPPALRRQAGR